MASEDFHVSLPPYEFTVDGSFRVDPVVCRAFLGSFIEKYGKVEDMAPFSESMADAFSDYFDCGALATWGFLGTRALYVHLFHPLGTLHTTPARRPRGPEPEDDGGS